MNKTYRVVTAGAGGFVAGSMVRRLTGEGVTNICAVDIKPVEQWYQTTEGLEKTFNWIKTQYEARQAGGKVIE